MSTAETDSTDDGTDTPGDITRDELIDHWTVVLAEYWRQTDWERFDGQQKRRSETFEERLLSAQNAGDVHGILKKLARGLGMAAPELPTEDLDPLVENDDRAVRVLRREDIYLVAKTRETVRNYFEAKQADDGDVEADDPEPTTSELSDFISE